MDAPEQESVSEKAAGAAAEKGTEDALMSMAKRWKHIGSALGLSQDVLNHIERTVGTNHSEALCQILSTCLAQSTEEFESPSWDRLVKAMAQCHSLEGETQPIEEGEKRARGHSLLASSERDNILNEEDHFEVMALLISVASRWRYIGNALGLSQDDLDTIEHNCRCNKDHTEAMSRMVSKWLAQSYDVRRFGRPSWAMLAKAVAHKAGGASKSIADVITRTYSESEGANPLSMSTSLEVSCSFTSKTNTAKTTGALSETQMLGDHPSYHQCICGEEAIRRLKASGHPCCYLTRYSEKKESYILTVYKKQRPKDTKKHFIIIIKNNGRLKIEGETEVHFKRIEELLEYYETHRIHPSLKTIGCCYIYDEKKFAVSCRSCIIL